ncbi:MAG: type II secretion system minor pseudopilin GspK [Alphaproteobacteria bacterium]
MTRRGNEDGAVLLTTLLVMAIMAALAVAIMDDVRYAVKRAGNVQAYAQTDWYVKGASEFAQSYLSQQVSNTEARQLNQGLMINEPIVFPLEGGVMVLSVRDGSQCFALNDLAQTPGRIVFRRLLEDLGWDVNSAARLTSIAVDWQDEDSALLPGGAEDYTYLGQTPAFRASNEPYSSVTELRALETMTEPQYQVLRPFVCTRSGQTASRINVNTLAPWQTPLLAAIIGGDRANEIALKVITERPSGGYTDLAAFRSSTALVSYSLKDTQIDFLSFEPAYIWVEADVTYLQARRKAAFEYLIEDGAAVRLYHGYGDDALRPKPKLETPPT